MILLKASCDDRYNTLSIEEYLNKTKSYLKDIMNKIKKSDTWKFQLTIEMNLISLKDTEEERLTCLVVISDKDEHVEELFKSV